jgi:translation initiation factor IF-2
MTENPCVLELQPNCIFNMGNPIIIGVLVREGCVKIGDQLHVPLKYLYIGRIITIVRDHVPVSKVDEGLCCVIRVEMDSKQPFAGRDFDEKDKIKVVNCSHK